ncbi:MAG: hypothetical protein HY043_16210, partial [Verrucomicrobia bacterium]|nr:hypothetical protein [Verrucomicrobiota bacterium]
MNGYLRQVRHAFLSLTLFLGAHLLFSEVAFAGNQFVRINEIMAGLNGDSSLQFVELVAQDNSQKQWGPQSGELVGRTMLVFFDQTGSQTGRYVFPSDPAAGAFTVLVATQEFADFAGIAPDFIMPKGIMPIAGKISFRNNPDAGATAAAINVCLSYGGSSFTGDTEGAGPANAASLSILDSQSLRRMQNFSAGSFGTSGQLNGDFALGIPTPSSTRNNGNSANIEQNLLGEIVLPIADSQANQGRNLFMRETFLGNGRTCATCHIPAERFSLPPARVAMLPDSDPLFINEQNVNRLIINSLGSTNPAASSGTTQPSDFQLGGIISGSLGGSARVLAGTGNSYLVIGGSNLNVSGNVIGDLKGNRGTLVSFTAGNLAGPTPSNTDTNGLENSSLLRVSRALILENINGFTQNGFMRGSPSLMNLKFTAPYGLSGNFPDLQSFAAGAVRQHFPRSLNRTQDVDFRAPTTPELDALAAFQNSLTLPANEDFDEAHQFDRFLTTSSQRVGRDAFFGFALCSACHGGKTLSQSDGRFGTTAGVNESFNTGVMRRGINLNGAIPTEQDVGQPSNTRRFSVPSLIGAGRTAPFFHENSADGLDQAVIFYDSSDFGLSPASAQIGGTLPVGNVIQDIAAFLQVVGEESSGTPTIAGIVQLPTLNDNAATLPFLTVTIADPDTPPQQLTVVV